MTPRICSGCDQPMRGFASITVGVDPTQWFCHDDGERPSCYEKAQQAMGRRFA